jgi:CheY-like chemotaxis protein
MRQQPVVLYVEDDGFSREVMQLLLVEAMHLPHVTIFEDSQDFLQRIAVLTPRPNIILLDIHMTPYDGFEMLKMIRSLDAFEGVPVVALTASVMNEEVRQLKVSGFNGAIAKPIDQDTFEDTVYRMVNGEQIWRIV